MKKILSFTIIIILIPVLIIGLNKSEDIINKIKYGSYNNKVIRVKRASTSQVVSVPLEEYVIGVVAGEMPVSFNIEALKAQAVAARTYVLKKASTSKKEYDVEDGTVNQVFLSYEDMKKKWPNDYEQNLNKVKTAVKDTKGEVILYKNDLIDAMFFSTSNGYTENSGDVFSSSLPYLVSVDSSWDKSESPVFNTVTEVSKKEFLFNLGFNENESIKIDNVEKTNTGRVKSITINGKNFKSNDVRNAFGLKSTSFSIDVREDKVSFNVNGYGHGVGMSQYGANGMAKEGYKYHDILKHYYQNCDVKKVF